MDALVTYRRQHTPECRLDQLRVDGTLPLGSGRASPNGDVDVDKHVACHRVVYGNAHGHDRRIARAATTCAEPLASAGFIPYVGAMMAMGLIVRCVGAAALSMGAVTGCFDYEDPVASNGEKPDGRPDTSSGDTSTGPQTTWHEHVRPLVETHCVSCHATGGIGAMPLDSYEATAGFRQRMVARVNLAPGSDDLAMPPWPFDPTCREVHDARILSPLEKAVFTAWAESGYPEGDPGRYVPPPVIVGPNLGEPQVRLTRDEGYTPSRARPDDYRCFLYGQTFEHDTWVTAVDIVPDKPEVVHHVLLFVVPPDQVSRVEGLDQAAAGPGYVCVGGSGANDDALLAGWVPGMRPIEFPPGSAFPIRAGSRLVAQMHYNTVNLANDAAVPADRTGASLWSLTPGQIPAHEVRIRAVADLNLDIAKGESEAVEGLSVRTPFSERAVGVIPHMHMLGTSLTLEVERPGNPARGCLARIPVWDFHWQQTYMFTDAAQVELHLGDKLHLGCVYDNSAANQAVIDGVRREPEDVTWGEGTFDEMCLAYVVTTTPIYSDQRPEALCNGFASCFADRCGDADALCAIDCLSWSGLECAQCAFLPIYDQCARDSGCIVQLAAMGACIGRCPEGMDTIECVLGSCADDFQRLHVCLAPSIAAGECNEEAVSCGIGAVTE